MDRVAVVTGSRSGIGAAVVQGLLAKAWHVVGLDVSVPSDSGALELVCDVASPDAVAEAFAVIAAHHPAIDALICCAGVLRIGALAAMDVADFDLLFAVNTRGPWLCVRAALPLLRQAPGGSPRVVLLGSISGLRPKIGSGAYAASKEALHTLTGVLAAELAGEGILVNAIAPGTVDTPMMQGLASGSGRFRPSGASPLGRMAVPADIIGTVDYLLGPASAYVTGIVLPVDGGARAAFIPPS